MKKIISLLVTFFLAVPALSMAASCPGKGLVQDAVKRIFRRDIKVVKIKPSQIPGLCQAQVKLQGQNRLLYTDSKGKFLVTGQIFRIADGVNITRETIHDLNRFTAADLDALKGLTAFTVGDKGPVVYFVTDPQCPYCKKAEAILIPMAEQGELQVRVLLFPLPFHKGAKQECISIICDNKGIEGLRDRYKSDNQCEAGKKKVKATLDFLHKKGISGTPTYIFPDGRYHSGVLRKDSLEKRLGLNQSTSKTNN